MNNKGDFGIPTNRSFIIIAVIIVCVIAAVMLINNASKNVDTTPLQQNQEKISQELQTKTDTIINSVDAQRNAIALLNQNIILLQSTSADKATVSSIQGNILLLNKNIEENNKKIEDFSNRLDAVENTLKSIEPSYVQNVDVYSWRSWVNIFNFRLVINFFIAIAISLFGIEIIKVSWDFLSFGYNTKNWNVKHYFEYRRVNKLVKIKQKIDIHQQHKHN